MGDSLVHQEYGRTRVQWLASLNTEYRPPTQFRRTSIICTIGECRVVVTTVKIAVLSIDSKK